jgi:tetratricopeptide (TPR) repeat protein
MNPLEQIIQFLKSTDELKTASTLLSTFAKYSSNVDQHDIIARLYHDIKDYQNSIIYTEKTLALAASPQQLYVARANLAKLYNHINNPDKALQYINANLTVNPTDYEAMMEKVFALYLQGNTDKSKQLTEQLLNDHNTPEIVLNRS